MEGDLQVPASGIVSGGEVLNSALGEAEPPCSALSSPRLPWDAFPAMFMWQLGWKLGWSSLGVFKMGEDKGHGS